MYEQTGYLPIGKLYPQIKDGEVNSGKYIEVAQPPSSSSWASKELPGIFVSYAPEMAVLPARDSGLGTKPV